MHTERAVLLHPAMLRTPWHMALAVALWEVASHLALTVAVVAAGAVAVAVLLLLLVVVAAPLGGALVAWMLWRSIFGGTRGALRLARYARRRGAPGLHAVRASPHA
jgi:hypothetical protein